MRRDLVAVVVVATFFILSAVGALFLAAYVGDSGVDPWPGKRGYR